MIAVHYLCRTRYCCLYLPASLTFCPRTCVTAGLDASSVFTMCNVRIERIRPKGTTAINFPKHQALDLVTKICGNRNDKRVPVPPLSTHIFSTESGIVVVPHFLHVSRAVFHRCGTAPRIRCMRSMAAGWKSRRQEALRTLQEKNEEDETG